MTDDEKAAAAITAGFAQYSQSVARQAEASPTLRDTFACAAVAIHLPAQWIEDPKTCAALCYHVADAMLKAREAK